MFEWHRMIQKLCNMIEAEVAAGNDDRVALTNLASRLGYSPYHLTRKFHSLSGITLRHYLGQRRLVHSVSALRDGSQSILETALRYGYSSPEAYSRAFRRAFGVTPSGYRRERCLLPLPLRKNVFDPYLTKSEEIAMNPQDLKPVTVSVVTLPAHNFLHLVNRKADNYFSFWDLQEKIPGQGCDIITGLLESIAGKLDSVTGRMGEFDGQIGGWCYNEDGSMGYVYGVRLPLDYSGPLPGQMQLAAVPQRDYVCFSHPPFDYETVWGHVYDAVESKMETYDYTALGREKDVSAYIYQIVSPAGLGYRVYVPLR